LDDLADHPDAWRERGLRGREYVGQHYGSRVEFTRKLVGAVRGLAVPLAERMRTRGLERAAEFDRARWRDRVGALGGHLADAGPRPYRERVEVRPRSPARTVTAGSGSVLVPVRVLNQGSHAILRDGLARWVLRCRVLDEAGKLVGEPGAETTLPGLIIPG